MKNFSHRIQAPQRLDHLVTRPRMNALLDAIYSQRLVTITCPAGYGKSSLLVDFTATAPLPVCWYTISAADADPWDFLAYLTAAIAQRVPAVGERVDAALQSQQLPFSEAIGVLIRTLDLVDQELLVVLDDWHWVDHVAEIGELTASLVLHCRSCRFLIASRTYPSLPNLMLMAARRELTSIAERHLRFTVEEAAAVISAGPQPPLDASTLEALVVQTNGWITGILLALQAPKQETTSSAQLGSRSTKFIYRYLVEQVFNLQPPSMQRFLLDTSVLNELCPELCKLVCRYDDAPELIEQLLQNHLFVSELRPGIACYHALFREFLQSHFRTLDKPGYLAMVRRVGEYFVSQGEWQQAFNSFVAAQDLAAARGVLAAGGEQLYTSGRLETLEHWFAVIPQAELDAPQLCLHARVLLDRGNLQQAETMIQLAELRMQPEHETPVRLIQANLARLGGRYDEAIAIAEQVPNTPATAVQQAAALRILGICYHRRGQTYKAIEQFKASLLIERQLCNLHAIGQLHRDIGICYKDLGMLREAERYYARSDAYWTSTGNVGARALSLNSQASVLHLEGRFQAARELYLKALDAAREAMIPSYEAMVLSCLGDLYLDLQHWDEAGVYFSSAEQIGGSAHVMLDIMLSRVALLARQRRYGEADRLLAQIGTPANQFHSTMLHFQQAYVACGLRQYEEAWQSLEALRTSLAPLTLPVLNARALLLEAQVVAADTPERLDTLCALLEQAVQITDRLGHDTFLLIDAMTYHELLHRAAAAGWSRVKQWRQRQQHLLAEGQSLVTPDLRPLLTVRTLGTELILLDEQPLPIGWLKAREVLFYLLANPVGVPIATLCEAIWPTSTPDRTRDTLRSAIYALRSALPRDMITLKGRQHYSLNTDLVRLDYDAARFLRIVEQNADYPVALLEAIELYRGSYLPGVENEWAASTRALLEQRYLQALLKVAAFHEELRDYPSALDLYQRVLAIDTLAEAAHAAIIRCHLALSNRAAALKQYHTLRNLLNNELGLDLEASSEAEQLYRQILSAPQVA